ncbi:uncharacterized protein VP01_62g11 [Puccinia sorghi]|uniref:Uncharacterized protein n=1 Tax=Puccinia sorghi TaxID=27349 RepID=A0A0L6UGB3_9BASI|nr:uncharacterized protein VP01_62g11 [Puccinia sorghi]
MAALGIDLFRHSPPPHSLSNDHETNTQGSSELTSSSVEYAKKAKTKTMWKGITSPKAFKIFFDLQSTNYNNFIEKVASESDGQFTSAEPLIRDATRTGFLPIEWHVYLLRSPSLPEFTKDSHYLITNLASFTHWITAVADLGKDQVNAGLQLKMESPGVVENRATAAVESQNHLRTQTTVIMRYCQAFLKTLSTCTWKNCTKNTSPPKKHNSQFPVFINPCNPNRYILLAMGAVQTWAHALCDKPLKKTGTPGLLINSPPESLQYLKLDSKKRKNNLSSSSSKMGDILMQLLASTKKKSNTSDSDDSKEYGIQSDSHTIETSQEKLVSQFFLFSLALYITHVLLS